MDQKITDLDVAISMTASDLIPIVDSNGDNKVLHGSQVKDYVADAVVSDIDDVKAMISDEYDNTATYAVGDYRIYNNTLYRCTTAISTAEDFTPAHWTETSIDAELAAANSAISGKQDALTVENLTNTIRLNSNCTVHHGYVSKYGRIVDFGLVLKLTGNINNNDIIIYGLPRANNNLRCPRGLNTSEYYANDYTSGGLAVDTDENDPSLAIVRNFSNITATTSSPKYIYMNFSYLTMN